MLLRIFLYSHIILILLSCSNKKIKNNDSINETIIFKKQLSKRINETSGLEYFDGNLITHNDSGGQPALYIFSTEGEISKKINIPVIACGGASEFSHFKDIIKEMDNTKKPKGNLYM